MKTILVDAINTYVIKGQGIDQEIFDLLESFPNRKIVLTNAIEERIEESDFLEVPYEIFTLSNDPAKTDPEYFTIMLSRLRLSAEEVVYFEHNPEAVKSAESVGILTYYFDPEKRDVTLLKKFLETNS
jgi:FMN phosphatase YigB (HAD superfamily)